MASGERKGGSQRRHHPVRVVSQRTGLSAHVLRAWERRHKVVTPVRTAGGQRLYSDADIERLAFLKALTDSGYSIGQLAGLPAEELRRLYRDEPRRTAAQVPARDAADVARQAALRAIDDFDAATLGHELESAAVALGVPEFLDHVLTPVLAEIGERWQKGQLSVAHEHLATAQVRQVLGWVRQAAETTGPAPVLVVATPAGQLHEGGALIVAAAAAAEGWRVQYLGANLPALEIAEAARRTGARAVGLSLLHPSNDPSLPRELRALREALPRGVALLMGGAAAPAYAAAIKAAGGELVGDLPAAREGLRALVAGTR